MKKLIGIAIILIAIITTPTCSQKPKVKLVLQITVDQLRGDVIDKYKSSFTKDGFYYLLNNGANFTNAHFIHSMTKTAPGHSTLSTGATPSKHGIVNNDWYEKISGRQVYSCEDRENEILGDPSDKKGRSPKRLMVPTLSDNMLISNPRSKAFGISLKDRGAILMAGHKGKAFWFSRGKGDFVTSKYYYDDYPDWLKQWEGGKLLDEYYTKGWDLIYTREKYQYADKDSTNYERTIPELGKTFPHKFINLTKEKFYSVLPYSPWGDRYTYEFAKALIDNEKLGEDDITDYLSISFSCTDYIGHLFGPNTLEYEDQILNLDKTLSDLFRFIDERIGLENVLIVLSADHGVCETPEYLQEIGTESGVVSAKEIIQSMNKYGHEKLGLDFDVVKHTVSPYVYLDEQKLKVAGKSICEIEKELSRIGENAPGVFKIYTSCDIENNNLPNDDISEKVKNSYYKGRSGNLYIINKPNWYLAWNPANRKNAATHGSPWSYDTFVPLVFAGPGINNTVSEEKAGPHDIAPTIAKYLGIPVPSGSVGKPLL